MSAPANLPRNLMVRNGIYYVRVKLDGRERWRSTGHTTLPMAIRRAEEILVELRRDRDWKRKPEVPTYGAWLATFLETHASPTVRKYPNFLKRSLGRWRNRPLDTIRPTDIKAYYAAMASEWSPSTIAVQHRLLNTVFNRAVDDGLIESNPVSKVEPPKVATRTRVLSYEEETKLRAQLKPEHDRWLTFMLGTGLRLGEACALRPEWLQGDYIHLPATATKGNKARVVPIFGHVREVLEAQLAERAGCRRVWRGTDSWMRYMLTAASEKAGIAHVWPHALRHTFATRYLQGGGQLHVLSRILGHASVTITEQVYAHLTKDDLMELSKGVRWAATHSATSATSMHSDGL